MVIFHRVDHRSSCNFDLFFRRDLSLLGDERQKIVLEVLHPDPVIDGESPVVGKGADHAIGHVPLHHLGGRRHLLRREAWSSAFKLMSPADDPGGKPPDVQSQPLACDLTLTVAKKRVFRVLRSVVGEDDNLWKHAEEPQRGVPTRLREMTPRERLADHHWLASPPACYKKLFETMVAVQLPIGISATASASPPQYRTGQSGPSAQQPRTDQRCSGARQTCSPSARSPVRWSPARVA